MPNSYQPGQRRPIYGENHKISEERYAWIQCELGKFLILVGEDKGHGSDVVLFHPKPGRQPDLTLKLTNLTRPELDALKTLIDTAIEWAEPVVDQRDKEAQDAWDAGDDSHVRNYRPLPTVVYRKRPQPQHGQGVRDGSEQLSEGRGHDDARDEQDVEGDRSTRVRGAGNELAEPEPDEALAQDDGTPSD